MQQLRIAFSILVGIAILAVWLLLYLTNSIPELETEPIRIGLHLAAELATGAALLAAGIGFWRNARWAPRLHWLAMGALLYTLIQSPGYYAQMGEYAMVIVFAILFAVTLFLVTRNGFSEH